jgi:hypothetical protein
MMYFDHGEVCGEPIVQAQPQFTPGQILEAGQRAAAEGRTDYARQFFQHLIDHYRDTHEAATARNELMNLTAPKPTAATPLAANAPDLRVARPAAEPPPIERPGRGHSRQPGGAAPAEAPYDQRYNPPFDRASDRDPYRNAGFERLPHHDPVANEPAPPPAPVTAAPRGPAPAREKNYIAGRVFSGLLGFVGLIGLPVGLVMLYGVFAEPTLFGAIGVKSFADALALSVAVFLGSIALILLAQMARALFDAADAANHLAGLERYRMGLGED